MSQVENVAGVNTGVVNQLSGYQQYLAGDFTVGAKDFIYKCGLLNDLMCVNDPVKLVQSINIQMNQVCEELSEILKALDLDLVEHIDGHVDSMFVLINFIEMNKYLQAIEASILEEHLNIAKLQLIGNIFDHIISYPLPEKATDEVMIATAKRIVINNAQKYTTDKEVADSWKLPAGGRKDGIKVQAVTHEDVVYYSLVDNNGKIRKHRDFEAVKIEDLLESKVEVDSQEGDND